MRIQVRGKEKEGWLTVSADDQFFPALLPASPDHVPPAGGRLPGKKTVGLLPLSPGGLIGSFHRVSAPSPAGPGLPGGGRNLVFGLFRAALSYIPPSLSTDRKRNRAGGKYSNFFEFFS